MNRAFEERITTAVNSQPQPTVTVLSSLLAVEDAIGYIPQEAVAAVANRTGASINDVWAVATFYPNFRFTPPCDHRLEICWGPSCHLSGAMPVIAAAQDALDLDGEGDTPDGRLSLRYNTCLGACAQAPVIALDHHLMGRQTPDSVRTVGHPAEPPKAEPLGETFRSERLAEMPPPNRYASPSVLEKGGDATTQPCRRLSETERSPAVSFADISAEASRRWDDLTAGSAPWIRVGTALCGKAAGADAVIDSIKDVLARNTITSAVISEVGCFGLCFAEPLVDIQLPNGPRVFYGNVTPETAEQIIVSHVANATPAVDLALGTQGGAVPGIPDISQHPMKRHETRIALRNAGTIDPGDIYQYIAGGGYHALNRALTEMTPQEMLEQVNASGLRGRGGAAFPAGTKWNFLAGSPAPMKYILCNCEEGDPGAFNDKGIVESDPNTVVEGVTLAGYACAARRGYIFIRHGHDGPIDRARQAISQAYELGLLGENILGSEFSFDLEVALTGDSYVSGEETALMEAIEGKRSMPRYRPPFPAQVGVFGQPSNINNVKTLAYVPEIVARGGEWFAGIGHERSTGTAIICLSGALNYTGMVEVPMGLTLREVLYDVGGGVKDGKELKLVQTGGPLGGVLGADSLDLVLDFEVFRDAGAILGSGGIIAADEDTCIVDLTRALIAFCQYESCGKCFPCRMGMSHLLEVLERLCRLEGEPGDMELMRTIGLNMQAGSLCGHGQLGFNPVSSAIKYFGPEFEAHINERRCPTGACHEQTFSPRLTRR